ncbi:MAG TPA: hypothetical protein VN277_02815 [Acidiferrobacterales bacterium]|nr:hypothetical protein [Acidiferrobacterales bacterium]
MKLDSRKTLLLLGAVCTLPVVASYLTYYVVKPQARMNYGELITPGPLPPTRFADLQGKPFTFEQLRGRWVMVTVDGGECDARCRQKLYNMRQVRTAQGKEMERIERVWLVSDAVAPPAQLLRDYEGTYVVRDSGAALAVLPAADNRAAHVYLIDPLGNLMLRFPENPDPKRMIKDFERLLKYSRIG